MIGVGQVQPVPGLEIEPLERLALRSPFRIIVRARPVTLSLVMGPYHHQLLRVRIRQRRQKRRPNDREDRHIWPDPQRQCQNRNGRESPVARQHAQPKTYIPVPVPHGSTPFSGDYARQPPEVQRRTHTLSTRKGAVAAIPQPDSSHLGSPALKELRCLRSDFTACGCPYPASLVQTRTRTAHQNIVTPGARHARASQFSDSACTRSLLASCRFFTRLFAKSSSLIVFR